MTDPMSKAMCEFSGCKNPQMDQQPETGMRFCAKHDRELEEIVKREPFKPGALFKFWLDARGGPAVVAKEIADDFAYMMGQQEVNDDSFGNLEDARRDRSEVDAGAAQPAQTSGRGAC